MGNGEQTSMLIPGNQQGSLKSVAVKGPPPLKSDISAASKKRLVEIFKDLDIISHSFTGKVFLHFGPDGLIEIERIEKIR